MGGFGHAPGDFRRPLSACYLTQAPRGRRQAARSLGANRQGETHAPLSNRIPQPARQGPIRTLVRECVFPEPPNTANEGFVDVCGGTELFGDGGVDVMARRETTPRRDVIQRVRVGAPWRAGPIRGPLGRFPFFSYWTAATVSRHLRQPRSGQYLDCGDLKHTVFGVAWLFWLHSGTIG